MKTRESARKTYRLTLLVWLVFITPYIYSLNGYSSPNYPHQNTVVDIDSLDSVFFSAPDSITPYLKKEWQLQLQSGDSIAAIKTLNLLALEYTNRVNYGDSYDSHWKALLLADQINNESLKAINYNGLAILYSLFERRDEALKYYTLSLQINKKLVSSGKLSVSGLIDNYIYLAVHYRYDQNSEVAKAYLDSCQTIIPPNEINLYTECERAYLHIINRQFDEAEKQMLILEPMIQKIRPSYFVVFYTLFGDLYKSWNNYRLGEHYYLKALEHAHLYHKHLNFVPDIYQKLSELYLAYNQPSKAYQHLIIANKINQKLYSSRSTKNKQLLEIKDTFRQEKEKQLNRVKEQRLALLEQQNQIWNLKFSMMIGACLFLIALGVITFRYIRSKHRSEKRILNRTRELRAQKTKEILELKNKELTSSALKLVEKDQILKELKDKLKTISKDPSTREINKVIKNINSNAESNWQEFESRFISVNQGFYDQLKERFPELNTYDLKICALLKLNFSGKEMAALLGISPSSANTSRYRLRKKLRLSKEDNLEEFIANID